MTDATLYAPLETQIRDWLATANNGEESQEWVIYHLRKAMADAESLDSIAQGLGLSPRPNFASRFMAAMSTEPAAWRVLCAMARQPRDGRSLRSVKAEKPEPLLLYQLCELLRDGVAVEEAVAAIADEIKASAAAGDWETLMTLGERLRSHSVMKLTRSDEAWILRAWLPLRLWGKSAGEIRDSLRLAWKLLQTAGVETSPFPENNIEVKVRKVRKRLNDSVKE